MAGQVPECIELDRHRDFKQRRAEQWIQRTILLVLCVLPVVALFNVFGQAPSTKSAAGATGAAQLTLEAPTAIRSGDIFQARLDIHARREIEDAVLVLDPGWLNSMTVNTIEPSPQQETSRDGSLALDLGSIPAGKRWTQFLEFQVNPVNLGSQPQGVTLYDGNVELAHIDHSLRIWP